MAADQKYSVEQLVDADTLMRTISSQPPELRKIIVAMTNGFIEGYRQGYEKARAELSANQSATP